MPIVVQGVISMPILAMYLPRPEDVVPMLLVLTLIYGVLCATAHRMKLSVPIAAVVMLLGCGIALAPGIYMAMYSNLGDYGNWVRKLTNTTNSDGYLSVIGYMHAGPGPFVALAGMTVPLAIYFVIDRVRLTLKLGRHASTRQASATQSPTDDWAS